MALLILLVLLTAFGLGSTLKIALNGRSRRIASLAGWLLLFFPALTLTVLVLKEEGPLAWFTLPQWLFTPWVGIPLLVLCSIVPIRSAWRRAQIHRDEAMLLEQARLFNPASWPELGYQALADKLGVPAVPIFLSKDVTTGYAVGILSRRILIPTGWVPAQVRGADDEYWSGVDTEIFGANDLKAILAHELSHHRDHAGLRGVLMELAGYLFPWEFVVGSGTDYRGHELLGKGEGSNALGGFLTRISNGLAGIGRVIWRDALDAERLRQERLADEEAERVFPPARYLIESIRGFSYSNPQGQNSKPVQVAALAGALAVLVLGMGALPGRAAWMRLIGGESPIPWRMPEGWALSEWSPPTHIGRIGFIPPRPDAPARIRVEYGPREYTRNSFAMVGGWLRFPLDPRASIPDSSHIQVDWPVSYKGPGNPWVVGGAHDFPPIFMRLTLDRFNVEPLRMVRGQLEYDGAFQFEPAGEHRTIVHMDWGAFPSIPTSGATLLLGVVLHRDSTGVYDIEVPTVRVVRRDGTSFILDPASSQFSNSPGMP